MPRIIFFLSLFTFHFSLFTSPAFAQIEITGIYDVADQEAKDGDIVRFVPDNQITRANSPYDLNIFGVVQSSPSAVYRRVDGSGTPIIRAGIAKVNVTTINGPIKTGDHITSSEIQGFGMKADVSGQVLGLAVSDFVETDGQTLQYQGQNLNSGQIPVAIKIEYAELTTPRSAGRLVSSIGSSFLQALKQPQGVNDVIKYIIAGIILILSILFGFVILLRSLPKSIEAIGRNPLARRAIYFSVILNILLVLGLAVVGIIASLIIINL